MWQRLRMNPERDSICPVTCFSIYILSFGSLLTPPVTSMRITSKSLFGADLSPHLSFCVSCCFVDVAIWIIAPSPQSSEVSSSSRSNLPLLFLLDVTQVVLVLPSSRRPRLSPLLPKSTQFSTWMISLIHPSFGILVHLFYPLLCCSSSTSPNPSPQLICLEHCCQMPAECSTLGRVISPASDALSFSIIS